MRIRNYRRWLEALGLLLLCTLTLYFTKEPYGNYVLKQDVKSKLDALTYFYQGRFSSIYDEVEALDQQLPNECMINTVDMIRDVSESSSGIKMIEVVMNNGICNQYGLTPVVDPQVVVASFDEDETISYRLGLYHDKRFYIELTFGDRLYRVLTDPFPHIFIDYNDCPACVSLTLVNESGNTLPIYPKHSAREYKVLANLPLVTGFDLLVEANDDAVHYYAGRPQQRFFWYLLAASFLVCGLWALFRSKAESLAELIQLGIENNEFVPYYHPIVDANSGDMVGCEVLVRWIKPNGELIPPNAFIPFAEENGQIAAITESLFQQVLSDISSLNWENNTLFASINVTPAQLEDAQFISYVLSIIDKHEMRASAVAIEVTERTPFKNISAASEAMNRLDKKGIEIKLDDAGTGYGGFSYLQTLPIQTLKIDKMFVDTVGTEDLKRNILQSIIQFGHTANLTLIAEGVETKQQVDYLIAQGVTLMQGFYFAKPMNFNDFAKFHSQST
ncbi:EAL domain-containing protein [Thaumasiovibrio subtropicus]|uniref:EAL domain-containing protein n=1 Tax=Thaumasiovibrio subtropicus TaxID=1891207 RepID=UPI000B34F603|nr:EAL domain-containing protein [Thaumasiovibrio subtropicus]